VVLLKDLTLVIPVLNEAANLKRLFASLSWLEHQLKKDLRVHVLLVDDGSTDGTADLAHKLGRSLDMTILRHEHNLGPGRAFATAFSHLRTKLGVDDLVITMEGDNTSRVELIRQMLLRLQEGFDVILASPYMYGGGIRNTSAFRVFMSTMANLFVKELLGLNGILTVSSFFRLYTGRFLKKMQSIFGVGIIERPGFECMTEMMMKMVMINTKLSEIAMVVDTHARVGKSRMHIWRTVRGYLALWSLKRKWQRMAAVNTAHA
jgi:dolichol-phosphate mannosyltransferase